MEYSISKLSSLTKISTRTLRYYDEIELLKPARVNSSGYRVYGEKEVNKLQQILLYKELGVSLELIKEIVNNPNFNKVEALREHKLKLLQKKEQIDLLLENVENTLRSCEGGLKMSDKDKFKGFKKEIIDNNEKLYGKEIREKYGDKEIDEANKKMMNMTEEEFESAKKLEEEIIVSLKEAFKTGDVTSDLAKETVRLHKKWICMHWNKFSQEAYEGIANMYVYDERFKEYYDKHGEGMAVFLRDSILNNSK